MTVYFNGGPQPLVPEGRWGEGVVMPGERYETEAELGHPWVVDAEAEAALSAAVSPPVGTSASDSSSTVTEAVSEAQDAPQGVSSDNPASAVSAAVPAAPETPTQEGN